MGEKPGWIRENEVTLVVAGIGIVYPNIFNLIGMVEAYHPGVQLRWQLARFVSLDQQNIMMMFMMSYFRQLVILFSLRILCFNSP